MQRVWFVGNSGSGKTTAARVLGRRLGVPHLELDSVFHLPGWQELDRAAFRAKVTDVISGDAWVIDGNYYSKVADLVQARADTIVWIDLPRSTVMRQLLRRTLIRMVTREELWNGNRERWSNLFRRDPELSILRWAWTQHASYVERYEALQAELAGSGPTFIRLRSRAELDRFLVNGVNGVTGGPVGPVGG